LAGLGSDYDPFVTSITTRLDPLSLDEIYGHLLAHEMRIEHNLTPVEPVSPAANISTRGAPSRGRGYRGRGRSNNNYRGRGSASSGRGRGTYFSSDSAQSSRPICQFCGKIGHTAPRCYQRPDPALVGPLAAPYQSAQAYYSSPNLPPEENWYPDTGATHHLTNNLQNLNISSEEYSGQDQIRIGNGTGLSISHSGSATLSLSRRKFLLNQLLHVPHICKNLLSVRQFASDNDVFFEFHSSFFVIKDCKTKLPVHQGPLKDGLYHLFPPSVPSSTSQALVGERTSSQSWHQRLGHPALRTVNLVLSRFQLPVLSNKASSPCNVCPQAKGHQLPFSASQTFICNPLDLIYSDVWGPSPTISINGNRFYVSFVDAFSRFTWVYPIQSKSDVMQVFLNFQSMVERLLNAKIKSVQTDWGGEYRNLHKYFQSVGILHRVSCPHTHQQQGCVERKHRHLIDTTLALLAASSLPKKFWDEACLTSCYLINRLPTPLLKNLSPFEKLFSQVPDYKFLKVFGCACFPNLRAYNSHKFSLRSKPCVFLGYSTLHKGYKCYHSETGRIYVSRDVIFHEDVFPFSNTTTNPASPSSIPSSVSLSIPNSLAVSPPPTESIPNLTSSPTRPSPSTSSVSSFSSPAEPDVAPDQQPTRIHPMRTRSQNNVSTIRKLTDGTVRYPLPRALLSEAAITEPTCFTNAVKVNEWRTAMQTEFNALLKNNTWTLVPASVAQNVVGCKWVFKLKRKADGSIERHKARLVAKGFHQHVGIDYGETFSPVVKPTTIRTVLSHAYSAGWSMKQIDIQNAFLHGILSEDVYMEQPPGFIHPSYPHHICKLKKALYGLKQAPRAWFARLSGKLIELGFIGSKADSSLFLYHTAAVTMFLLIYVDDIIIVSSISTAIDDLLQLLSSDFAVKDLGSLHYFLGIEVIPVKDGLLLSQQRYIRDLLSKTNMTEAKPVSSPMASSSTLSAYTGDTMEDPTLYRSVVGSLQYLSLTRPDLAFPVSRVCQFMHRPTTLHWQAVKRILRYLKHTISHGLLLHKNSSNSLHAYSDADWAGCSDDRRSTGAYCVYLGSNLISWSSRKQPTVSRSSTEAEYKSVANTAAEVLWIRSLLQELRLPLSGPPKVWCDNIGATYLSVNPVFHARTKHVAIDFHFVRELVASKDLEILFVPSADQIADVLTKPLASKRFQCLSYKLNVRSLPLPLREDIKAQSTSTSVQPKKSPSECVKEKPG